jgi:hypothetical protein
MILFGGLFFLLAFLNYLDGNLRLAGPCAYTSLAICVANTIHLIIEHKKNIIKN